MTKYFFEHQGFASSPASHLFAIRTQSKYTATKKDAIPLLFLGGSNSDFRTKRGLFSSPLLDYFDVISYDPRSQGRSQPLEGDWTMSDFAGDAAAILDAFGFAQAYIVGESFGAMTACEFAIEYPERVKKMALIVGAAGGAGGSSYPIERFLKLEGRERAIQSLSLQDTAFTSLLKRSPMQAEAVIQKRIKNDSQFFSYANNVSSYARLLAARAAHDAYDGLHQITAPTLVISGKRDQQAPLKVGKAMADNIPNSEFISIDGGHGLAFETDKPSNILIKRWLDIEN